jgi:hypothetical protein
MRELGEATGPKCDDTRGGIRTRSNDSSEWSSDQKALNRELFGGSGRWVFTVVGLLCIPDFVGTLLDPTAVEVFDAMSPFGGGSFPCHSQAASGQNPARR